MRLLSARQLRRARGVFAALLSPSVVPGMLAVATLAHVAGYRGSGAWLESWSLSRTPVAGALAYLLLLVLSVVCHEVGHLAVAVTRGDLGATFEIRPAGRRPTFVTYRAGARDAGGSAALAGVYFQVCFAAVLGGLAALGAGALRAPMFLADCAALLGLVPMPGTDGFRFLVAAVDVRDVERDVWAPLAGTPRSPSAGARPRRALRRLVPAIALFLALYLGYLAVTSAFLASLLYHWLGELRAHAVPAPALAGRAVAGALLLAPPLYLAWWGWARSPFLLRFLRRLAAALRQRRARATPRA